MIIRLTLLIALSVTTRGHAGDWPRWRGPGLDGISAESGWRSAWSDSTKPPVAWQASVGTGFSSVVVSDGRLYTIGNADNTDTVFCFDAATGQEIWKHAYPSALEAKFFDGGPVSTPTADGNALYTIGREGDLFCFDAASGDVRWSKNIVEEFQIPAPGWGFAGSPLVHDDLLLLNAGTAGLALKKATGELAWKSQAGEAGYSTPVPLKAGDQWQLVVSSGRTFAGVDLLTGDPVWEVFWLTRYGVNAADPVIAPGGLVFLSSGYKKGATLVKLSPGASEPEQVWKNKEISTQMNPCVLVDGFLYGFSGDAGSQPELKCVELQSGEARWSESGMGAGSVTVAAGKLIVLSEHGELIVAPVSPDGFAPTGRAKVLEGKCWTVPVLANGRIYCRNAAGDLVCIDVSGDS